MFNVLNVFDKKKFVVVCIIGYAAEALYRAIGSYVGMRLGLWAMK